MWLIPRASKRASLSSICTCPCSETVCQFPHLNPIEYNPKYRYPDELKDLRDKQQKLLDEDISPSPEFERMILCHIRDKEEFGHHSKKKQYKRKGVSETASISSSSSDEDDGQIMSDNDEIEDQLLVENPSSLMKSGALEIEDQISYRDMPDEMKPQAPPILMESISSLVTEEEAKSGSWEGRRRSNRLLGKHKPSNAYAMEDVEEIMRMPEERRRSEKQANKRPEVHRQWSKSEEDVITVPIPPPTY